MHEAHVPGEDCMSAENRAQDIQYTGKCWDLEIIEVNVLYNFVLFFS